MDEEEIKRQVTFGTGYKNPPQHTQFKKGQSGNPKGRPKKVKDEVSFTDHRTLNMILDVADRLVPVRENGEVKHMSMREVVANALYASGAKGDPRALATVFALTMKGDVAKAEDVRKQNAFWQAYKNAEAAKISAAMVKGEAIPKPLPHPKDVIIDYQNGPRFIGPLTEQEQRMLDETIRLRDILILQDALDRRSSKRLDGEALIEPGGAELLAMMLEHFIPPRLRLSDGEWIWWVMKAESLSKRTLLKQLHEQWRALGHPVARGFVVPDLSFVKKHLESRMAMAKEIQRLPAPDKMPRGEWERAAVTVIRAHVDVN